MLRTRRSSWGRPSEWVKWTHGNGAYHHQTHFILDPFVFSPLRLAPGWDLSQHKLCPYKCSEPGGRSGAGRLNGSNGPTEMAHITIKLISFWTRLYFRPYDLPQDGTFTNINYVHISARNQEVVLGQAV